MLPHTYEPESPDSDSPQLQGAKPIRLMLPMGRRRCFWDRLGSDVVKLFVLALLMVTFQALGSPKVEAHLYGLVGLQAGSPWGDFLHTRLSQVASGLFVFCVGGCAGLVFRSRQ